MHTVELPNPGDDASTSDLGEPVAAKRPSLKPGDILSGKYRIERVSGGRGLELIERDLAYPLGMSRGDRS
jgi:hypothetical protein